MKKSLCLMSLVLLASCGSLRIIPKNCKTTAVWGTSAVNSKESVIDIKAKETFYVFSDLDLKLGDLLEENGIRCEEVKSVRVVVSTSWFFMRDVSLKVVKK